MNMLDLLSLPFVQRALMAAVLLAVSCGVLSFFVVQRKLAFMGHGIAHSMVAGVGLGLLLGLPVFWPALVVALLISIVVGWISRSGAISEDSAIGISLSSALALGLVLISLQKGYVSHLESYLLGNVLSVLPSDLILLTALALLTTLSVVKYWSVLLMFSFDPEGTRVAGYPVDSIRYSILILIALLVAVSMKIVGILLVGALLVIPASAAVFWSARSSQVILLSTGIAVVCAAGGLVLAMVWNATAGAMMVLLLSIAFLFGRLFGPFRE